MIECPEVVLEGVSAAVGGMVVDNAATVGPEVIEATGFPSRRVVAGESLFDLMLRAARPLREADGDPWGGIIVATFSAEERFPSLAVRLASALGLGPNVVAFDVQMACSAYPYAVYLAGRIAADTGRKILVVDGDVQSHLSGESARGTGELFSDAATATLVSSGHGVNSRFDFLSRASDALTCPAAGPIRMDGFKVFAFVATDVVKFLRPFAETPFEDFVPHQANLYMVRQLSRALKWEDRLLTCGAAYANPGSCSVALALAAKGCPGRRVLIAGFGAGFSASAGVVRLSDDFKGFVDEGL